MASRTLATWSREDAVRVRSDVRARHAVTASRPARPALPPGMTMIDAETLAGLRAAAGHRAPESHEEMMARVNPSISRRLTAGRAKAAEARPDQDEQDESHATFMRRFNRHVPVR